MPSGDGTGPLGLGPRTGRGLGYCGGFGMRGYANRAGGHAGRGRGGGRGWRHSFYATGLTGWQRAAYGWGHRAFGVPDCPPLDAAAAREQELSWLQSDLRCLEETAERLRRRIDALGSGPTAKGEAPPK
jgi:hypothetical protein